jgi:hypothetical protein
MMPATMTPDIIALCAALDKGDYDSLSYLADALEDASDPRAEHLRLAAKDYAPYVMWPKSPTTADWFDGSRMVDMGGMPEPNHTRTQCLPGEVFSLLSGGRPAGRATRTYPSISAAYLDLAEALAKS